MKKNLLLVLMCMFTLVTFAKKETTSVTFNVPLDCKNCIKKVESNIAFEKGVKDIACDLAKKTVTVTYAANKTNVDELKEGFAKIGYKDITVVKAKSCSKECKSDCGKDKEAKKECCKSQEKKACCDKEKKSCCDKDEEEHHHEGEAEEHETKGCCSK